MATHYHKVGAYLLSPYGRLPLRSARVSVRVNDGWSGSVTLRTPIAVNFAPKTRFQIVIWDEHDVQMSAPMVASMRRNGYSLEGPRGSLEFHDAALYDMAQPGVSFPTFLRSDSLSIQRAISQKANVPISGLPYWWVNFEEIKQSKPIDALRRLGAVAGMDLYVSRAGTVSFRSARATSGDWPMQRLKSIEESRDLSRYVTGCLVEKQAPIQNEKEFRFTAPGFYTGALPQPMGNCSFIDTSVTGMGFIGEVGFWKGDPAKNGSLVALIRMPGEEFVTGSVVPSNAWPADHWSLNVIESTLQGVTNQEVDAGVKFTGTAWDQASIPIGVDASFRVRIGDRTWPMANPWVEPLIPSAAWVTAHEADYIFQRNRDYHTVQVEHSCQVLAGELGQKVQTRIKGVNQTVFRADEITTQISAKGTASTTVSGPALAILS